MLSGFIETTAPFDPQPGNVMLEIRPEWISSDPYIAYISGPMTGIPNYNYFAFHAVAEELDRKHPDWTVIDPSRNFEGDQTLPRRKYLSLAVRQVSAADALVLLPDWYMSEGAVLEATLALDLDMDFWAAHPNLSGWDITRVANDTIESVLTALADPEAPKFVGEEQPEPIEIEAGELVRRGARRQTYGHPRGDFDRIAAIWTGILAYKVTAEQVALCMSGLKLARLAESPQHRDSKKDSIGYIVCLDELEGTEPADWAK